MYGNKIPEKMAFPTNEYQAAQYMNAMCSEPVEDRQTVLNRVTGTFYQARELADEICQVAEILLGPSAPNMTSEQNASPTRGPGILNDIDDASDGARRQMNRAFDAIKRLRAAL